jgi:hypothetical protein
LAALLKEFSDVVNTSQTLPPLPATNVSSHQNIRAASISISISSKFRPLDKEKLMAAKLDFEQLEKDGMVRRSDSSVQVNTGRGPCGGNCAGIKSGRINVISSPVPACKIRKEY